MPDRGGRADLGGGVGPSSCSRTVLLTTPAPCTAGVLSRLTENPPSQKFADTEFHEVRHTLATPSNSKNTLFEGRAIPHNLGTLHPKSRQRPRTTSRRRWAPR